MADNVRKEESGLSVMVEDVMWAERGWYNMPGMKLDGPNKGGIELWKFEVLSGE